MKPLVALLLVATAACAGGPARPGTLAPGQDACAQCRMVIVSAATAAQIAAPGAEHLFFDDIGCLRDYLKNSAPAEDAVVYVSDHRTGLWVEARRAVFTRAEVSTPMASGLLAHAGAESRDADAAAAAGAAVPPDDVLGPYARRVSP